MYRALIVGFILALSVLGGSSHGQEAPEKPACCASQSPAADPVQPILDRLQSTVKDLKGYQCDIDYVYKQPLLESQTRRTGKLYYIKLEKQSFRRGDFETIQYDDEKEAKRREQFFFDGI